MLEPLISKLQHINRPTFQQILNLFQTYSQLPYCRSLAGQKKDFLSASTPNFHPAFPVMASNALGFLCRYIGWSNIDTVLKYYLKSSDENEKKAVRILDRLMEEGVSQTAHVEK